MLVNDLGDLWDRIIVCCTPSHLVAKVQWATAVLSARAVAGAGHGGSHVARVSELVLAKDVVVDTSANSEVTSQTLHEAADARREATSSARQNKHHLYLCSAQDSRQVAFLKPVGLHPAVASHSGITGYCCVQFISILVRVQLCGRRDFTGRSRQLPVCHRWRALRLRSPPPACASTARHIGQHRSC